MVGDRTTPFDDLGMRKGEMVEAVLVSRDTHEYPLADFSTRCPVLLVMEKGVGEGEKDWLQVVGEPRWRGVRLVSVAV